jgi:predicted Zn-dependent protease
MKQYSILYFVLVCVLVASCATSPLGRRQLLLMPEKQMDQLGVASYAEMKKKQKIDQRGSSNRYVSCVANAITHELTGKWANQSWEVTVFEEESPNAFALPGGKIGVHTGLFKAAENQHQLAAVIGHEVGHVMAQHGNERVSTQMATQTSLQVIAAVASGASKEKQQILGLLGLGAQFGIVLPFSRKHESEADEIGLDLMARAGFDPRESVTLWENMGKLGGDKPPEFMSTHPSGAHRIRDLGREMDKAMLLYKAAQASGKNPQCGSPGK